MKPNKQSGTRRGAATAAPQGTVPALSSLPSTLVTASAGNQMFSIKNRLALKHQMKYLLPYTMLLIKDSFQLETVVLQKKTPR